MPFTLEKSNSLARQPYWSKNSPNDLESFQPLVNSTIKPLERELSTEELEKGELVLNPKGEMFRVLGNPHSKGGTPVALPEGSFVFSNHKPLAIDKKDKELFKFKEGGKTNSTPAKQLQREVDLKHHNKMVAISSSDKHDNISKKSAELMLQKNFKRAGQVAFLQEEKKGFPQGLPSFSEGTAPLEDPNVEIMEQQYQNGGFTSLNKFQIGGKVWPGDKYSGRKNASMYSQGEWDRFAKDLGFQGKSPLEFQQFLHKDPRFTGIIDNLHEARKPGPNNGMFDGKVGYRWDAVYRAGNAPAPAPSLDRSLTTPVAPNWNPTPMAGPDTPQMQVPESPEDDSVLPYNPEVGFSPLQTLSMAQSAYTAANINKYAPKRMQTSFTPLNLERTNAQPYINQINSQTHQAYRANQVMNPIQARASNSNVYGQSLDKASQVLGNIDNQNRQISNTENQYNNQGINRTAAQNVQLDNTYYNQVQTLNQNYDTEKTFARNRLFDEYKGYRTANDSLELQLQSQPTYGTIDVYQDPKTGQTSKTPQPGWIKKKQAAPLYDYNNKTNKVYFTGAGMDINQVPSGSTANLSFQQLKQYADDLGLDARGRAYIFRDWAKQSNTKR